MIQKDLVMLFVEDHGEITPAKMAGRVYRGEMFGSETSKRCRELYADGLLERKNKGRFTVYFKPSNQMELF